MLRGKNKHLIGVSLFSKGNCFIHYLLKREPSCSNPEVTLQKLQQRIPVVVSCRQEYFCLCVSWQCGHLHRFLSPGKEDCPGYTTHWGFPRRDRSFRFEPALACRPTECICLISDRVRYSRICPPSYGQSSEHLNRDSGTSSSIARGTLGKTLL